MTVEELECLRLIKTQISVLEAFTEQLSDSQTDTRVASIIDGYKAVIDRLERFRHDVIKVIAKLPDREMKVLLLYYDVGMTWQQVADAIGVTLRGAYHIRERAIGKTCKPGSTREG